MSTQRKQPENTNSIDQEDFYFEVPIPIPAILLSVEMEGPFRQCIVCRKNLLQDGVTYMIEKGFKQDRTIFEYALCTECKEKMAEEVSAESACRMIDFWRRRVNLFKRRKKLLAKSRTSMDPWIEYCIVDGTPRQELRSYLLYAECEGNKVLLSLFPLIIGEPAVEQIARLLSKKTREVLDDFTEKYLGLPPELVDLPQDTLLLI